MGGLPSYQPTERGAKSKPPPLFHERRARRSCKCENFLRSQHSKGKVIFSWLRPLIANARRSLGVCLVKKHLCPLAAPGWRLRSLHKSRFTAPQVEPPVKTQRTAGPARSCPRKSREGRMDREGNPSLGTGSHPWMAARSRGMNE